MDEKSVLKQPLERHRHEAEHAHKYCMLNQQKKCAEEWAEVSELEGRSLLTSEEEESLAVMKHKFNILLAANYHMSTLLPYWGSLPPYGSMYLDTQHLWYSKSFH